MCLKWRDVTARTRTRSIVIHQIRIWRSLDKRHHFAHVHHSVSVLADILLDPLKIGVDLSVELRRRWECLGLVCERQLRRQSAHDG